MSKKFVIYGVLFSVLLLLAIGGYKLYSLALQPNVSATAPDEYVCIPTDATFDQVVSLLATNGYIKDSTTFRKVAALMHYNQPKMREGRFKIERDWGNYALIKHLKLGKQAPVKAVFHDARLLEDVAGRLGKQFEADSTAFMAAFTNDTLLQRLGFNKDNLMSIFIPNTYEIYWNSSPTKFLERMKKEHDTFWQKNDRLAKAQAQQLTPAQIYTLASIVEKETLKDDEKPMIAGLYLNRLRIDMPLQADPTAVFATRDFDATRVLEYHLRYDSPYNTYMYKGLPPGPIYMASIASIDAVLSPAQHNYIFMCAKPDESGYHAFAETMDGHRVNANLYREWLDKRGY